MDREGHPHALLIPMIILAGVACSTSSESACAAAWDEATSVSVYQDTHDDYRPTFTDCATHSEWRSENIAHGERIGTDRMSAANFCETLSVSSPLCSSLEGESINDQTAKYRKGS